MVMVPVCCTLVFRIVPSLNAGYAAGDLPGRDLQDGENL